MGESGKDWAIDWTSRRTWLRFGALTLCLSAALILAVLGTALVVGRIIGTLEPAWLNIAVNVVPTIVVWAGFLHLIEKWLKFPSYVADLDVLTMDRSLITPNGIFLTWAMCIIGIAVLSIVLLDRLSGEALELLPEWWFLLLFLIPVFSETDLVWTMRKLLGEELPPERASAEAATWNRLGPISIVWNLLLGLVLLFLLFPALNS